MSTPDYKQTYADTIRQLIPVNELPADAINRLIAMAEILEVRKKTPVFRQGDRDNYSYYLLAGEIALEANNQVHNSIVAGTERALWPMAQLQPRQFTGIARTDALVMRVERNGLDKLLVMSQNSQAPEVELTDGGGAVEVDIIDGGEEEGVDWMTRMLQSEIFASMPTANIHQLFALLEPVEYKAGANVITQGETGQHYYIIQEGRCEVLRQTRPGMREVRLAELRPGDGFGEEALITETTRNATIRMLTDGVVAQLSKDDFVTLIKNPTIKAVTAERAKVIIDEGGKWLDVRFKNEHDRNPIEDSLHVPLNILRLQLDKLDRDTHFVAVCDTGGRSSTAAFLLTDRGFTASYLSGGLMNYPELAPPEDVTQTPTPVPPEQPAATPPPVAAAKAEKPPAPAVKAPAAKAPAKTPAAPAVAATAGSDDGPDEEMDPEIMATVLDAELTTTRMRLERAQQQDQTDVRNKEMAAKLEAERRRIEEQKKRVEAEVSKLREQEEQRLRRMEEESEKRMQQERKKIEEVYTRNAEEMEKLERMKQEAEQQLRAERERLEREAEEARRNRQDAENIRQELEAARRAMEEEAKKREAKQEAMRRKIEMEARQKIEVERRRLAEQVARNSQEIEQARREKAIAEAAREAARKEAELMIEEYKSQHERTREEQEAQLRAEREKLEQEQKNIQQALIDIQRAKAEAEAMKRAALAEVTALKTRQLQEDVTASEAIRNQIQDKIRNAQEKLAKATEKAAMAEKQEEKAVVARETNEADLQRKKAEQEELAKQLQADLADFKEELEEQEREYANSKTQLEHMRRIKERAEAAKKAAAAAADDLLSDVASQLGDRD